MVGMGDWGDTMKNKFCLLHGSLSWFKTPSTFPNKSMYLQRGQPFKSSVSGGGAFFVLQVSGTLKYKRRVI